MTHRIKAIIFVLGFAIAGAGKDLDVNTIEKLGAGMVVAVMCSYAVPIAISLGKDSK
jgi:hypothetical protein